LVAEGAPIGKGRVEHALIDSKVTTLLPSRPPTGMQAPDATIDLTDLDRFAAGFPHDVFTRLRREAPVWFHPPTPHTPGGEGFWVLTRHADIAAAAEDAATFSSQSGAPIEWTRSNKHLGVRHMLISTRD
jgi:cytochrome P450